MNIQPSTRVKVLATTEEKAEKLLIAENKSVIINLATLENLSFCEADNPPESSATTVSGATICYVCLEGVIDFDKEISRLEKELEKNTKELNGILKRLNNDSFLEKAPEEVIEKVKAQHEELKEKQDKITVNLDRVKNLKQD
jgi:valyl-tRNA synthetase